MGKRQREVLEKVKAAMQAEGAEIVDERVRTDSHQEVSFLIGSRRGRYGFAATPGGIRGIDNAVAHARRKVRLIRDGEKRC